MRRSFGARRSNILEGGGRRRGEGPAHPGSAGFERVANLISSLLARLRGQRVEPEAQAPEGASALAGLRFERDGEGFLSILSPLLEPPLLRVRATLGGPLEEKASPSDPRAVEVTVPLAGRGPLRATVWPVEATPPATVVRSVSEKRREAWILHLRLDVGMQFRFEAEASLEIRDVATATPLPSLFATVPPAPEMATFLRGLTQRRRPVPRILQSLSRNALSPETARHADRVAAAWPAGATETHPVVQALCRLCERQGRHVNPASLEGFCLLVDLERGIPPGDGARPEITSLAAAAVASLLGVPLSQESWQSEMDGPLPDVADPAVARIVAHLRDRRRTPLDILEDLGGDTGSRRVVSVVRTLRPLLPGGRVRVNDEQQALLPLLEASGRPVHPETMIALCLFVDIETGDLTEERAEALAESSEVWDTSMYAMVAVAGAFGLDLQAYAVEGDPGRDDLAALATLASRAEGGLLACFRRPGETARRWEWIRAEEDARRAQGYDLDFSGIVLARLPSAEDLRPLEAEQLHGHGEVLSREHMAFRQIQAALRRLASAGRERVSLRQEPAVLEAACEWLRLATLLDPVVHGDTRRNLVQALRRDPGLDVRAERRLVGASGTPQARELLGLFLLQELCLSPRLKADGFQQYDERALRALLLERTSALLGAEDPALRALAPRLLASADLAADRATRLGTEYPLGTARTDPSPAVATAAVEALIRLALSEVVPLPRAMELVPADPQAAGESSLAPTEVESAWKELASWLARVGESDAVRPMGLPITDAAGALDAEKARPLAETMAAMQQASRRDGSWGQVRWLGLATVDDLAGAARALLESWRAVARPLGRSLAELDPQAQALEHRLIVEDHAARLLQRCGGLPYLGGPGRPVNVYRAAAGKPPGPWIHYEKYRGVFVTEEAPLFTELLERGRRVDLRRVRVLRFPAYKPATPDGSMDRQTARLDGPVDLREVEVLDPRRVEFLPLLKWFGWNRAELGLDAEPEEDVQAALALGEGRRPSVVPPASPVERPAPPDEAALARAAASLARQFELEGGQERVLRLLRSSLEL